jgi:hypothetical protein
MLCILAAPLMSLVPTLGGYMAASPPERNFLGFRHLTTDFLQYASFIDQARESGSPLMKNRLTGEPQAGRYVLLYLWLAGLESKLTGLGIPAAWHLLQFLVGALFLAVSWRLLGRLLPEPSPRLTAFLLVCFGGGLEWIPWLMGSGGGDPSAPGSQWLAFWNWSTFGSLTVPPWIAAQLLFLTILLTLLNLSHSPRRPPVLQRLLLFVLTPVVWLVHPYTGVFTYAFLFAVPFTAAIADLLRLRRPDGSFLRDRLSLVAPGLLSLLPMAVFLLWVRADPVYAATTKHLLDWRVVFPLGLWPLTYGLILIPACVGLWRVARDTGLRRELLLAWVVIAALLSQNPWLAGYKFQFLLHLPLCILAARGVVWLAAEIRWCATLWRWRSLRVALFLVVAAWPLIVPFKDLASARNEPELFASQGQLEALAYLRDQPDGTVLATYRNARLVAWHGGHVTWAGHWFLTLDYERKQLEIVRFFSPNTPDEWKRGFLGREGIEYLFLGPEDASLGYDAAVLGTTLFESEGFRVVEVLQGSRGS